MYRSLCLCLCLSFSLRHALVKSELIPLLFLRGRDIVEFSLRACSGSNALDVISSRVQNPLLKVKVPG